MAHTWARWTAAAVVAAGGVVMPSAEAAAPAPSATVVSVSKVHLVNGKPFVAGTYSCTGKLSHLWVSAKQGRGNLAVEGSGAKARAWWERTRDNKLNCDGNEHTVLVRLHRTDKAAHTGRLIPEPRGRRAWVQFCIVTGNNVDDLNEGTGGFDSSMKYRHVIRG
jgi:hypothetical protein